MMRRIDKRGLIRGHGRGERAVSYVALWLKGLEIIAEDEFEDLLEARDFVVSHLAEHRRELGVTAVRVCDDHTTYFQIE
jgi:hypothetical protein